MFFGELKIVSCHSLMNDGSNEWSITTWNNNFRKANTKMEAEKSYS